jgi:hypothetical protein
MLEWMLERDGQYNAPDSIAQKIEEVKKEEFPGLMENMLPGNSFPQICVVSIKKYVENSD